MCKHSTTPSHNLYRVSNFLKLWVDTNPRDFLQDTNLAKRLLDFGEQRLSLVLPGPAETLCRSLRKKVIIPSSLCNIGLTKKLNGVTDEIVPSEPEMPPPILPNTPHEQISRTHSSTELGLMDIDPEEMARQITLMDFERFKAIQPSDFFNKAWTERRELQTFWK